MGNSQKWLVLSLAPLLITGALFGQSFTAAVRGTVTDASGGAVPSAKVVITESERNVHHPVVTDESGRFFLSALPPGLYHVSVEAKGFRKYVQTALTLAVQQQVTLDVQLQVGDVSTAVEVTGSAALLNTTISNLGQVIENKYILSLPNIGRNAMGLTYMTPGVVGSGGRANSDNNTNFVANGSRNSTSDVLLDGVTVVTVEQNSGITDLKFSPSVDAVQEFKMQTSFFSAEYGQTGGAVVNMVTKSGTNEFHGTGYYFLRHSDLNANNWFSNRSGRARPFYRRDQLGGVVGGPVKKDKTFFFASYEYTKAKSPTSQTQTWPALLQRDGDFSKTFNSSGQLMAIHNPFDTFTNASGNIERRPFAGNVIPKAMMDPVALKALAYFPKPNQTGAPFTETNNWYQEGINTSAGHQTNLKGDHNFSDKSRLTGRYSYSRGVGNPVNLFGEGNPAYTFNDGPNQGTSHATVVEFTRAQNSTFLWSARYGLTYSTYFRNPMVPNFDLTSLGFPSYMKTNSTLLVFPTIAPEGYQDIGTEGWVVMDRQEGVHHVSSSASKFIGGHSMKFGGEYRKNFLDYAQPGYPSGQYSFARGITCKDRFSCPGNEGNGLATMLTGWWTSNQFHIDPKVFTRSAYWGFFFQDDWKISRKLTLNLGFRYDFDVPRWETQNRQSYWDLNAQSSVQAAGYNTKGVIKFNDSNNRSPFNKDMNNWQPRIGLAYAVNNKTSIRTGYGLFYQLSRATVFGHTGAGFNVNSTSNSSLDSNATLYARLSSPYPDGMLLPPGSALGDKTFIGLGAGTILGSNSRNPEYQSWNLSIQRELGWQSVLEVNYTGSRGTHLFLPVTTLSPLHPNYWSLGRTALTAAVANPFFGQITDPKATNLKNATVQRYRLLRPMPQFDGTSVGTSEPARADSNYHALQLKWEKRYSTGLTMMAHYTWSKMIDNASYGSGNYGWLGGNSSIQNIWNLRGERSLSSHDISHRAVFSGHYEMPFGKGRKFAGNVHRAVDLLVGGWNLSGLATLSTGMPLQVTQSGGNIWDGTQRPDLIGDPSTSGRVQDRLNNWFNAAAFFKPAIDVPGTAPRTLRFRGPGMSMFNAALLKSFRVTEGQRFEFRLEAENAFNHPVFSDPSGGFGATNFGQITGAKVGNRNVQLGLKYYF
ncbi:MAG: carboxypeptidase regulatory-like domain-containing protein [Candidatus Solibacter usitatus]|nr:carboxypeptidase regulatory-like domain-containing protein [Candidatus Solibacter usitatus]